MNSSHFEDAIAELRRMHERYPDWRLGQIVANVAMFARGPAESAIWDVEDEEVGDAVRRHLTSRQPTSNVG